MKILITGATGLLGSHLIDALQKQRYMQLRALVLPAENADALHERGVEVVRGDITDAATLPPALQDSEIVLHLAGMMGVWRPLADYRLVNVTGSANLYRAAQAAGVRRFVHTSSHTVYGLGYGRFLSEDEPLRPDPDPYSLSKTEGERLLRSLMTTSAVETVILRPGTFFGPNDQLHFARMARKTLTGRALILGSGHNALPFCYVDDVVQGFLLAAFHEHAPGNTYNISNDQPMTQLEIYNAIADSVGGKRPVLHLPYRPIYFGANVAEHVVAPLTHTRPLATRLGALMFGSDNRHSIAKARRELGYEPQIELREGIQRAAAWFNATRSTQQPTTGILVPKPWG